MAEARRFAVFDIDGTLLRWQLFHAAVNTLAKQGALGENTYQHICDARMQWKERRHDNAFRDYEELLVTIYLGALGQLSPDQFDAAVERTIDEYKNQVYTHTHTLLKDLKQQGYLLLAISGSPAELITHIADHYGFDDWVASTIERKDGVFTGNRFAAHRDKHLILEKLVHKHNLTYKDSIGVGDTAGDITMLETVEHPIAFNPSKELYQHARSKQWNIVIERKNVIYQLESRSGQYILA